MPDADARAAGGSWELREVTDAGQGRSEVEALFTTLGEASGWSYPPHERLEALGSLAAWVWISPTAPRWEVRSSAPAPVLVGTVQLQLLAADATAGHLTPDLVAHWQQIADRISTSLDRRVEWTSMAVIARLAVHPTCRRAGLGSALLGAACQRATALGLLPVLSVLADQAPALALYRHRGGIEIARRTGLSGREVLVLTFPTRTGAVYPET